MGDFLDNVDNKEGNNNSFNNKAAIVQGTNNADIFLGPNDTTLNLTGSNQNKYSNVDFLEFTGKGNLIFNAATKLPVYSTVNLLRNKAIPNFSSIDIINYSESGININGGNIIFNKNKILKQEITIDIGSKITDIAIVTPNLSVLKPGDFSPFVKLSNSSASDANSSAYIKIIEVNSCGNNLTLNSKKNSLKITNIPTNHSIKVNTLKQVKKHLVAKKVFIDSSQKIECSAKEVKSLQNAAEADFLRDNIICKNGEFPLPTEQMNFGRGVVIDILPPEVTALIGSFVDGKVKSCNMSENFTVSVEDSGHTISIAGSMGKIVIDSIDIS